MSQFENARTMAHGNYPWTWQSRRSDPRGKSHCCKRLPDRPSESSRLSDFRKFFVRHEYVTSTLQQRIEGYTFAKTFLAEALRRAR